ncbi:hypothetical protein ABEB36_001507 [Hypothenemus hampei]|uniref:RRM domain-containing protein n=1 Tax=Hypothenemus hampei TaxID=57062 RepID=A0ABD1FES3_HYPHA
MVCKDTLRIKHLPKELSDAQKEAFIRHFGAYKVKVITSKAKAKSVVYAKFENEEIAKNVMFRLHQINILNCRLSVEYADTDILEGQLPGYKLETKQDSPDKKFLKSFINSVNAFNDSVGFYQPPPAHLKYNYPKANRPTINNIAHALATVPRFYTQVLHLMNKMNLPPPFVMPEPPVRTIPGIPHTTGTKNLENNTLNRKRVSSEESEIESDGEGQPKDIIPERRPIGQKKVVKRPKFIKQVIHGHVPPLKPNEKVENVFEKVDVQPQRKIELKVNQTGNFLEIASDETKQNEQYIEKLQSKIPFSNNTLDIVESIEQKQTTNNVKRPQEDDKMQALQDNEHHSPKNNDSLREEIRPQSVHTAEDEFPCISLEELRANQVVDLTVMPVFKNYTPGEPTNKLYIKNCAKTVVLPDLEYIYNRYREDRTDEEKPREFNIRLMQEGRMKGQAFVTLDSVEQAQRAVKETNGFILKDKPLVVVFGKAGKKK